MLAALEAPRQVAETAVSLLSDVATFTDLLAPSGTLSRSSAAPGATSAAAEGPASSAQGFDAGAVSGEEREVEIAVACVMLASELLGVSLPQVRQHQPASRRSSGDGRHSRSEGDWGRGDHGGRADQQQQQHGDVVPADRWEPQPYAASPSGDVAAGKHNSTGQEGLDAQQGQPPQQTRAPGWLAAFGVRPARVVHLAGCIFDALLAARQGICAMRAASPDADAARLHGTDSMAEQGVGTGTLQLAG